MAMLRKAVLATAMISTGLLSTTGMALAGGQDGADDHGSSSHDGGQRHGHGDDGKTSSHDSGATYQRGLINSGDIKPNTSPDLCNNDVPVNVLGVQVPLQDVTASLGLLSHSDDHSNSPGISKSCSSPSAS